MNEAYSDYAPIYAATGQGWLSLHLWSVTRRWLGEQLEDRAAVLDIGCGAGDLALALVEAGYRVHGLDSSAAMLGLARERAAAQGLELRLERGDISTWRGGGDIDIAVAYFDTFNYLVSVESLAAALGAAATAVRPGGWLAFDLNTEHEYRTWPERATLPANGPGLLVYNQLDYDEEAGLAVGRIVWFRDTGDGWERGEEEHLQRAHSDSEVVAALEASGWVLRARLDREGEQAELGRATRVLYIAERLAGR